MKKNLAPLALDSFLYRPLLVADPAPLSFKTRGGGGLGGFRIQGPGPATPPPRAYPSKHNKTTHASPFAQFRHDLVTFIVIDMHIIALNQTKVSWRSPLTSQHSR